VPKVLEALRKQFKQTVPTCQLNNVCTLCYLLDGLLGTGDDQKKDLAPEVIENFFVWAAVWAFGGNLLVDKSVNHSKNFSAWWIEEFKTVKFGGEGLVFDYQIDTKDGKFMPWQTEGYLHTPGMPVSTLFVETAESSRVSFLMDLLITNHHFVMLVGNAGTGKTVSKRSALPN
jgi:dynein heavy chain